MSGEAGRTRRWIGWSLAGLALAASLALDSWLYHRLHTGKEAVEGRLWYSAVRSVGTLWFWGCAAAAIAAVRPGAWRRRVRAGLWVFGAALLAGVAAEGLKMAIGRERPILHDGASVFRSISQSVLSSRNLSFPSSHAAVAFGGAFMVWRLRAGVPWGPVLGGLGLAAACACGFSRTLTGAHFVGDVVAGGMVGALSAIGVHRCIGPRIARKRPGLLLRRRAAGPAPGAGTLGA